MNRCSKTARKRRQLLLASVSREVQTSRTSSLMRLAAWGRKIFVQGHPILKRKVEEVKE